MRRFLIRLAVVTAGVLGAAAAAHAQDSPLKKLLTHTVIEPQTALAEVQLYTEARVPPLPQVETADQWEKYAQRQRQLTLDRVVYRGEAAKWRDAPLRVEWQATIEGGPGYKIKKLRYEALPGLWIPALLYEPDNLNGKTPVVMNVNGHDGKGKAADYKQLRCINQAKRGMLALNVEWLGMGQLSGPNFQHYKMNQLDLCGTAGVSPFFLSMKRGIDVLLSLEYADPERVAVAGLSGGGWQTSFISGLDTRVTLANPVAGYSSFRTRARFFQDLGDSEQTPVDLATTADYAQLTAMRAPRPTLLTFNAKDNCCFRADHALPPLLEAAGPIYKLYGKEQNLRSHVNEVPGDHNFGQENREALYRMLGDHFFAGDASYKASEIPSENEVKTADELKVDLPEDNASLHSLAVDLSKGLPRKPELPSADHATAWRAERRADLTRILRAKSYKAEPKVVGMETSGEMTATYRQFNCEGVWTVPAVEISQVKPKATAILISENGRGAMSDVAEKQLAAGKRVLAVDPFFYGESKIASHDFLFALLVSAIGDRPLGLQASQVAAIARWAKAEYPGQPVEVIGIGPRASLVALSAAALDENIDSAELQQSLGSLHEIIEQNRAVNEMPEMFCAGLLEQFDLLQRGALVAPRKVVWSSASDRAKKELAPLKEL
ncbi:MAG TPA: hypothetical protein VHB77_05925, partial [Planctomycetaceae bacterium]|nr:hypothetical protein [Planctomycetaceae bacterium]